MLRLLEAKYGLGHKSRDKVKDHSLYSPDIFNSKWVTNKWCDFSSVLNTVLFFQLDKYTSECDIIQASTQRHLARYFSSGLDTNTHIHLNGLNGIRFAGSLTEVELIMNNKGGCQKYPHKDMDEHCR